MQFKCLLLVMLSAKSRAGGRLAHFKHVGALLRAAFAWSNGRVECAGVRLATFDAAKKLLESAEAAYAEEAAKVGA